MTGLVHLFDHDLTDILAALPALDECWAEETWRQSLHFTPHRDSETIFLRRQPGSRPRDALHQLASVATRHYGIGPLAALIHQVCAHVDGRPARAMLVRLKPGGRVEPHTDEGIYAAATVRFHVALITNPKAWLEFGGLRYHVPAGMAVGFDKHVEHSAGNDGDEWRLHLICDVYPDSPAVLAG